jgi:hypothetical protein
MSSGIIRHLLAGRFSLIIVLCSLGTVCVGCTKTVPVTDSFPSPVIEPLPLDVGLYYNEALQKFTYQKASSGGIKYKVILGPPHLKLFERLFGSMFQNATPVHDVKSASSNVHDIDAIIAPTIDEYVVNTPDDNGTDYYEVSIRYQVSVYSPLGELITSWPVTGYGKSRARKFKSGQAVGQATTEAMRDAAAFMAIEFRKIPEVKRLTSKQSVDQEEKLIEK